MHVPVFTQLGKRKGNARIPDQDIIAMRDMGRHATTEQVAAAFPHVSNSYVRRVLKGKARADVDMHQCGAYVLQSHNILGPSCRLPPAGA